VSGPAAATLAVLGTGYMGGSLALSARAAAIAETIVGFDCDEASGRISLQNRVVDRLARNPAEAVESADIVVFAAPVEANIELASSAASAVVPGALVMDIGSVKARAQAQMGTLLGETRFVACHPMAGDESTGAGAARADVYAGCVCLVCPTTGNPLSLVHRAEDFWRRLGTQVMRIGAAEHDRTMAAISHLPHVAAFALAAAVGGEASVEESMAAAGGLTSSLRDSIRIAGSSAKMWRDIFIQNKDNVLPAVARMKAALEALESAIGSEDRDALLGCLDSARDARARLVGGVRGDVTGADVAGRS